VNGGEITRFNMQNDQFDKYIGDINKDYNWLDVTMGPVILF
jgi:hypothetical protein